MDSRSSKAANCNNSQTLVLKKKRFARPYTELFEATTLIRKDAFSATSNTRSLVSILIFIPGICHWVPSASQEEVIYQTSPEATVSSQCLLLKHKNSMLGLKLSPKLHLLSFHLKLHTFSLLCQMNSLSCLYPWILQAMIWMSISCYPLHICLFVVVFNIFC